jgi:DNA-binding Lrp family transcriptional regulator
MGESSAARSWTFLTHHGHVLVSLSRDPTLRMRDIAEVVGVTERATATLVADLERAGYLKRFKEGRRNRYQVDLSGGLRHPINRGVSVSAVFAPLIAPKESIAAVNVTAGGARLPERIPVAR